jgi:DNA repair protein RadD
MSFELRWYQRAAVDRVIAYFEAGMTGNPLVVLPTGAGKSIVIAAFVREALSRWPGERFLMLTHVKELVEQNAAKLEALLPPGSVGVYCAGLGRKELGSPVTAASIQSAIRPIADGDLDADLVLIDECHLVPKAGEGQYRTAIEQLRARNPHLRVIGLSATPYRTDTGLLTEGDGRIFTDVVIDVPIPRLIHEGFLSPLRSKGSRVEADLDGVTVRAGDYAPGELEAAMLGGDLVPRACDDIMRHAVDRSRWLVFASGVSHALAVAAELDARGVSVACVFGETPTAERDATIAAFKRGELRALVNVGVLTTGFDAPETDCVVLLRPTKSPGLYYQMTGRGFRIAPGKADCLVLDFGGNVRRHGPVDRIRVDVGKSGSKRPAPAPVKTCPECDEYVALSARECACGYEWPREERKHDTRADDVAILGGEKASDWLDVDLVKAVPHLSRSSGMTTLRVDYQCGMRRFSEYVCLEHEGFARRKAEQWWRRLVGPGDVPTSAVAAAAWLAERPLRVRQIEVQPDGKYERVTAHVKDEGGCDG